MTVTVQPAPDRTLDLAAFRRALSSEGVRLRHVDILAEGAVEQTPDRPRFRIDGWPEGKTRIRAGVRVDAGKPVLIAR